MRGLLLSVVLAVPQAAPVLTLHVNVYHDEELAALGVDRADLSALFDRVNEMFAQVHVRWELGEVTPLERALASPCDAEDSIIQELLSVNDGAVRLGLSGKERPMGATLGCAVQDGFGETSTSVAAAYYSPYSSVLTSGTEVQSSHHRDLLLAHELGHLVGGTHELAWPPPSSPGITGTIMYPTLQYNIPRFSGLIHGERCLIPGEACRIMEITRGQGPDGQSFFVASDHEPDIEIVGIP